MKQLISKTIEIDMGHRVPGHAGKCRNLHGHRYRIEAAVLGELVATSGASDEGMVVDFGDLKKIMLSEIDEKLDHGFMMYEKDALVESFRGFEDQHLIFVPFIPTAENIAKYIFGLLKPALLTKSISLSYVKVWETPTSMALYEE
tara:strand:+ start:86 stop:520 length:435 start_codon:yes stop_codon:yes gene_type:complete